MSDLIDLFEGVLNGCNVVMTVYGSDGEGVSFPLDDFPVTGTKSSGEDSVSGYGLIPANREVSFDIKVKENKGAFKKLTDALKRQGL